MASTEPEKIEPTPAAPEPEVEKKEPTPPPAAAAAEPEPEKPAPAAEEPPPETKAIATGATPKDYFPVIDVALRFLLFASSLVAVVVMVSGNQTKLVAIPIPPFRAPLEAKFNNSPALIYFVAALSVAALYSIITTLLSIYALLKPNISTKLLSHFVIFDVLLLGIVAAATGSAGAVGYIGLKGNSHVGWQKICNTYDVFCKHIGSSIFLSLVGSVVLALLVLLSIYSLSKKIPK